MTIFDPILPEEQQDQRRVDFVDDPLETVTQDNLDITCRIGGRDYDIVDVEIELTEGSASNWAAGVIVPDGHSVLPTANAFEENERPESITIDVDNELMEIRPGASREITRLFTGVISNASRIKEGAFEFMAFWPGYNKIQNGSISVDAGVPLVTSSTGLTAGQTDYSVRRQYTKEIAQQIGEFVVDDTDYNFTVNMREDGWDINGITSSDNNRVVLTSESTPLIVDGSSEGVLERVIKASNAVWEVDRYGDFHIGPPTPNGDLPTSVTSHKLRYITETSAGIQSPAWGSIVVIGDGVVSQDGWSASAQISEEPQKFSSPVTEQTVEEGVRPDLAEPVFEYVNLEINTATEAEHVLEKLRDEIKKQRAGGELTIVGHPEVWPGDGIELPDSENQPFGLERFAISKVTHRLNNTDGFLTKLEVMGATNAVESTFSDEIDPRDFPSDRYDSTYTDEEIERLESGLTFGL